MKNMHEKEPQEITEIRGLAAPLVRYLQEKHNPHCSIIITDTLVALVAEEIGIPFILED